MVAVTTASGSNGVVSRWLVLACLSALAFIGADQARSQAVPPDVSQPSSIDRVPVLDRIRGGSPLRLGYGESSIPFSYTLATGNRPAPLQPIGYAMDICQRLAVAVARAAGLRSVRTEFVPVTAANRFSLVETGRVDLECGATTNNAERRKRVDFTIPHFITGARLLVRSDSPIQRLEDLRAKKVVSTTGSTPLKAIEELNRTKLIGAIVTAAADYGSPVELVEKRAADAYIMDDVMLAGLAASRVDPTALKIVGPFVTTEPLAIMLPKGDTAFKKVIDDEMRRLIYSGEMSALYDRWFLQPIPPANRPLNLPKSYLLRDFWRYPTDKVPL